MSRMAQTTWLPGDELQGRFRLVERVLSGVRYLQAAKHFRFVWREFWKGSLTYGLADLVQQP